MDNKDQNINIHSNTATVGLNQDNAVRQLNPGQFVYALNAAVENYDNNGIFIQNEPGNELCIDIPDGFILIGKHFISERNKHIFFIVNPDTSESEIGYMDNNDCIYRTLISAPCLNFDINHPIHKVVHKMTNCSTEIYWTDGFNPRRYMDIDSPPRTLISGSTLCDPIYSDELDCNQLKLQPVFSIPSLDVTDVVNIGTLIAGTYQFTIQYADAAGNPYTSYYSVTNPLPIADIHITTSDFNYPVGKSIIVTISNLDSTGYFKYFNLAVIKTINSIPSPELVGTYFIDSTTKQITYTGQGQTDIKLSMADIFEKYPYYDVAQDVTAVQDVILWDNLSSIDRLSYQEIANNIHLMWETWRIPPGEDYSNETNAANLRGYLRDEVYAFEIVFLLNNGKQTDGFHIPGRVKGVWENRPDILSTDPDYVGDTSITSAPYWKIYNTASVTGFSPGYSADTTYKGAYQYGEFAYWESEETYPCNQDIWGELAGEKIRHHKFPDIAVSPIFETKLYTSPSGMEMGDDAIFPIGIRVDTQQITALINSSSLTKEQKAEIIGFKIVRGDRSTNKSIIAKGMLRNVGSYERDDQTYLFPNYPYNDLSADPFLLNRNNAYTTTGSSTTGSTARSFTITVQTLSTDSDPIFVVQYIDAYTGRLTSWSSTTVGEEVTICSISFPSPVISSGTGCIVSNTYTTYRIESTDPFNNTYFKHYEIQNNCIDNSIIEVTFYVNSLTTVYKDSLSFPEYVSGPLNFTVTEYTNVGYDLCNPSSLDAFTDEDLKTRQIFNSPETSFGQPFLGNILKLESVMYGKGKAHFTEVKKNARYRLISEQAQRKALDSSNDIGLITGTGHDFGASAMFAAYQSYISTAIASTTRRNFAYSFNSIADYNYCTAVPNDQGVKQRNLDIVRYLIPGVQNIEGDRINNYQRESSIYLKTETSLPFPDDSPNMTPGGIILVTDDSRFTVSEKLNCNTLGKEEDIYVVSYYASLKNEVPNQWGQIYSYETIDTGFQKTLTGSGTFTVFGGDTFINRFAYKTKLPFFIDNRVNAPDDSDIFYDEIGNVAYPRYWHSSRSILKDYISGGGTLSNIISYKAHNFDCPNDGEIAAISGATTTTTTTIIPGAVQELSDIAYYDGYFYLFAYGVPSFYCESSYNLDLRQAFNDREGDFWSHVSSGIPDDWVQESFVSIANDNTYTYNPTFSKQNRENSFTHVPPEWENKPCYTHYPFRVIYSDPQVSEATNRINNWLIYSPLSYFDFPQNYGALTSLDGIQNKAILARFENKSLLYHNLLTLDTSNPQMAYLGNPSLFTGQPPIDFAETDLGYVGSQHKMLLKVPQGQVTVDAKRGQVFLISGTQAIDLSGFGSGMNRFFTDHLAFEILRYFPTVDIDNAFLDIGLHGVYDSKFDRIIITKLDYIPLSNNITYSSLDHKFFYQKTVGEDIISEEVYLTDTTYFCNKSWTLSFNMNTRTWISFHSYIPNWYIAENNFFYSGTNDCCTEFDFIVGESTAWIEKCRLEGYIECEVQCQIEGIIDCNVPCSIEVNILDAFPTTTTTTTLPLTDIEYGLLYNSYAANDVRNITSSEDWRVSTNEDWIAMALSLGFTTYSFPNQDLIYPIGNTLGGILKEVGTSHWTTPNTGAMDSLGFSSLPGGGRSRTGGGFSQKYDYAHYMSNTEKSSSDIYEIIMYYNQEQAVNLYSTGWSGKESGTSIRLVRDTTEEEQLIDDGTLCSQYIGNDGKVYPTIKIGTLIWLGKNLAETLYRDLSIIPEVTDNTTWASLITGALCAYNNDWNNV